MKNDVRIGCSGYYYPAWKNKFYPAGLQPKNWLDYYSTVFNTIELNGTFYRTPKVTDLKKYASVTPDDFTFAVKVNKTITHLRKMNDTTALVTEFQDLVLDGLEGKLAHFLFQLPPSFHYSEENHPQNVVELRHASWWNDEVKRVFTQAGLTFCNVDFPGMETPFIHTTDYFYLRLHGSPDLFKSSYTTEELDEFRRQFPKQTETSSIYFNNTYYEAGYTNARELIELMSRPATIQEHHSKNDSL
jgi:uncharacterized protein YecE (DUF72 family)